MKPIPGTDLMIPDGEEHLLETSTKNKGRPVWQDYQIDRLKAAYQRVDDWTCAIDAGAHVGLISRKLAERFERVYAFEPHPDSYECLVHNTKHLGNVTCINAALGSKPGRVGMDPAAAVGGNSGNRQVDPSGSDVEVVRLDDVPGLRSLGLIKIDVQGYEDEVILGGKRTIGAFAPIMIVECEPRGKLRRSFTKERAPIKRLLEWGAVEDRVISADTIFRWGPNGPFPYPKYEIKGDYHWRFYADGKTKQFTDTVVSLIQSWGYSSFLDVGCGDGLYTKLIGDSAFGIDSCLDAIQLAKKHDVPCEHLSVYRVNRLNRLNRRFDAVGMFDAFEHLPRQETAIELLSEITNELVIVNPDPIGTDLHFREFTGDEMEIYFKELGWDTVYRERFEITNRNKKTLFRLAKR